VETPLTQQDQVLSQNTRDTRLLYDDNPKSLSHLVSKRYWAVTDGQTARQTDTETELP